MQTRSQSNIIAPLYEVNIDFDEASRCWKQNKKPTGNGCYKYVCSHLKKDGTVCGKGCYHSSEFCWSHRKQCTNN